MFKFRVQKPDLFFRNFSTYDLLLVKTKFFRLRLLGLLGFVTRVTEIFALKSSFLFCKNGIIPKIVNSTWTLLHVLIEVWWSCWPQVGCNKSTELPRCKFFIFIFKKAKILAQPSKYLLIFLQRINQFFSQIFKFLCCAGIVLYVREAEAIWKDDSSSNFLLKFLIMKSLMLDYYFKIGSTD